MEMEQIILLCEENLESIFSAVFLAYEMKCDPKKTHIQFENRSNMEFFTEYIYVEKDSEKASKMAQGLKRRFGETVYEYLMYILCADSDKSADVFYHVIDLGLSLKHPETVFSNLGNGWIMEGFELKRKASKELHHLMGFLRFEELKNGILFAKIHPKTDCILFLARHFSDRLPGENFVIYDMRRKKCIIHSYHSLWYMRTNVELEDFQSLEETEAQKFFAELFKEFCKTIAIKERKNEKLQQNMLPLHFRDCMVEFNEE